MKINGLNSWVLIILNWISLFILSSNVLLKSWNEYPKLLHNILVRLSGHYIWMICYLCEPAEFILNPSLAKLLKAFRSNSWFLQLLSHRSKQLLKYLLVLLMVKLKCSRDNILPILHAELPTTDNPNHIVPDLLNYGNNCI